MSYQLMTTESFEVRFRDKDLLTIISILETKITELDYKVKKAEEESLEYYSLYLSKNLFYWIVKLAFKQDRVGDLVIVEISRKIILDLDKIILEILETKQRNKSRKPFWSSFMRYWWLYYSTILSGSILLSFIPNGNPISIVGYVLVGLLSGFLIMYYGRDYFHIYQRRHELEHIELLGMQVKHILESIENTSVKQT